MKTNLEDISTVKKRLLVEIEPQEVDGKLNEAYKKLGKKATIPGFRPGKVPRKLLETYYGTQVIDDVTRDLISDTLPKAMEDVKTFPLTTPSLEKESLKQGQSFKYSAVMEVLPHIEVGEHLGSEVQREKCSVTEEDVRNQLERIREANGKLTPVEEKRPVKKGDYVILDYEAFEGNQPLEGIKSADFLLKVGSNDFHPKFEESLIGLKQGEETKINVNFEETYSHSMLAGKNIDFKVKIAGVSELVLPELDDDFAKNLDPEFKDLEYLRKKVMESITAREKSRIDRETKQRLLQKISEGIEFELPQVLVESEIEYSIENIKQTLERSGSNLEKAGLSRQRLKKDLRPVSEKRVKERLILGEIAKKNTITLDEEDLVKGFEEMASSTGKAPETLRRHYEDRDLMDYLRERWLEEKTLNYLLECAKIVETDKENLEKTDSEKETS